MAQQVTNLRLAGDAGREVIPFEGGVVAYGPHRTMEGLLLARQDVVRSPRTLPRRAAKEEAEWWGASRPEGPPQSPAACRSRQAGGPGSYLHHPQRR